MKFFDTHAHIGLIYDDPIEQLRVIQQAKQAGVVRIVSINNSLYDFNKNYPHLKSAHICPLLYQNHCFFGNDWLCHINLPFCRHQDEAGFVVFRNIRRLRQFHCS